MPPPRAFEMAAPQSSKKRMRSGGAVLLLAALQLLVGLAILGLYEGYKGYFFNTYLPEVEARQRAAQEAAQAAQRAGSKDGPAAPSKGAGAEFTGFLENPLDARSPMGFLWYASIVSNVFAVCGIGGVVNGHRELVLAYFAFSAIASVGGFHVFVDMFVDARIRYPQEPPQLTGYEKAAAALILFNWALALCVVSVALRAVDEMRARAREQYNRLAVLSDSALGFEADV